MPKPQIAIVEDETILREELAFQLTHLGFSVETFADASQFYRRLAVHRFAAIILDIGLDGEDGLTICNYLREHDKHVGIVFVTARAQRDDRLIGLHAGADAYLNKPVDVDELVLILQRLTERDMPTTTQAPARSYDDWQLDNGGDFLRIPGGKRVRLSVNELRLLRVLLSKPGEVAVAQELACAIGLLPEEYDKHRLEVIISRLRDKVLRETGSPLPVLSKRGVGYLFQPEMR
ncbi:response regulator transcription factor [Azonexus sp.]|uniref:response regulator transcription factor n=1 Tax=Azonexus sp. TaxID=1872668 RepID=UPI0027B9EFE5|nr:response regulator transcription factor [Azonexus sp.]